MGEYDRKQKKQESRAIAYNGGGSRQLKGILDNTSQMKLIKCISCNGLNQKEILQRAISNSATFLPSAVSVPHITTLHGLIPAAEITASNAVQNIGLPVGFIHTPRQAAYMATPNHALWGSCVEEQLNSIAIGIGWQTQVALNGVRPDYNKQIGNINLWVDLTTAAQAGFGGNHITGKLNTAIANGEINHNWEAADITHAGLNPGGAGPLPAPMTNGRVTQGQMNRLQSYNAYVTNSNALFEQNKEAFAQRFNHRPIHHTTFTQIWNSAERINFASSAGRAGF